MNSIDRTRLRLILEQANELLDKPAQVGNRITNLDVLEAVLGDVGAALRNSEPSELATLIKRDKEG